MPSSDGGRDIGALRNHKTFDSLSMKRKHKVVGISTKLPLHWQTNYLGTPAIVT